MFENIGTKIMNITKFLFWTQVIAFLLLGIMTMFYGGFGLGILVCTVGFLVAFLDSVFTYAFGKLVENSEYIADIYKLIAKNTKSIEQINLDIEKNLIYTKSISNTKTDENEDNSTQQNQESRVIDKSDNLPQEIANCPFCNRKIIIPKNAEKFSCVWCKKEITL